MIDERHEELASLYAFDLLEGPERADFEAALARDAELQALVCDLRESAAALAHTAPAAAPPEELKSRILASLDQSRIENRKSKILPFPALPWAVAACLALLGAWLAQLHVANRTDVALARTQQRLAEIALRDARQRLEAERILTQRQLAGLDQQLAESQQQVSDLARAALDNVKRLADLQAQADLAQLKIAALVAMTSNAPPAVAVAVWSPARHEGVFQVEKLPPPAADQKYELWIIEDPGKPPVSAGVFDVGADGAARTGFKPTAPIASAAVFAVSREKNDGARAHAKPGEVVMVIK